MKKQALSLLLALSLMSVPALQIRKQVLRTWYSRKLGETKGLWR